MYVEPVESHGYGVSSESSRYEQAVHVQSDPGLGHPFGVQLAVEGKLCKINHCEDGVLAVCVDDVRVLGQRYVPDGYARHCR